MLALLVSSMHATCPAHFILCHGIISVLFGEERRNICSKQQRSLIWLSLCSFRIYHESPPVLPTNIRVRHVTGHS